jgi:two-component system CheB/CheR fusion protein
MHDTELGNAIKNELTIPTVSSSDEEAFFVVGIGASAGGLEALEQFFEHVPEKSRLCFVVVQHLSPDFKSMMDELLARRTRIPIVRVEDGIELRPNAIYLMPPRKEMIQSTGRLYLTDKDLSQGFALPIDRYLRSLAQDFGSRSIGVILSGTGSDGSRGIRDIHDACGLVLAQSEESSRFDGMPRSARETGLVDLVLPPSEMPDAILKLVRMRRSPEEGGEAEPVVPEVGLQAIFRMLRKEYGIDFSHYKPSTVTRRVERRLLLNNSMSVKQYVELLSDNGAELNQLYKDLLIGVTQFFRDREAFHLLASEELPRLLEAVGDDQEFRVWVACCATGEEAYSIAILIQEQLALMNRPILVRIFATDAHRASLEVASTGVYSEASLAAVNPQRRAQFFVPKGDGYQVAPHIRKMIVFAPHDLLKDTPFTRLHLVTCRNMLIYLQPPAQKKVLSLFHFGLKAGCVLFLGPSETTGELSDEFESIDERWKIFRKRRDVRLRTDFRLMSTAGPQRPRITSPYGATSSASDRLQQAVYDRLLEEHMPPSFLINDRKELVHSFGKAGKFLRVRDGRASTLFLDLIDNDLKMILLGALARAEKLLVPVVFTGVRLPSDDGHDLMTRLTVKPINDRISGLTSFLILLEDMGLPALARDENAVDLQVASRDQLQALELELGHTRENLQALIEEQESSNEELQATNEELVASNEELQSTNEELHSVNEELYTVNAEYQHKIEELTQVTADLENLFLATDVGIVFLDRNLCIRRFTPRAARLLNLLPHDSGRPLSSFAHSLDEPLMELLNHVLETGRPIEKEVRDREGNCYFLRILPYRTSTMTMDGVVLSLIDISPLKVAEAKLQHLSAIVRFSGDAIIGKDLEGRIISWNRGAEEMFGYSAEESIGRDTEFLYPAESAESFEELMAAIRSSRSVTQERRRKRSDGSIIDVLHTVSPICDAAGRIVGVSTISRDITVRKKSEQAIQDTIRNRDHFLAMLSHELRNPLSAILYAAQMLDLRKSIEGDDTEASGVIRRQAEQMRLLLDDLLDVARVTQNKIVLRREVVSLGDIIAEELRTISRLPETSRRVIEVEGMDQVCLVDGDPARLHQVVINLLRNAVKYSSAGEIVTVKLSRRDNQAVLSVRDTGVGIAPDMLDQIFELFVQSRDTIDRAEGGLGVGLTLVRAIIELHGGTIRAFSQGTGFGSEFTIQLPLAVPQPSSAKLDKAKTGASEAVRLPSLRIAIIEDNSDVQLCLRTLLEMDGNEVRVSCDGIEGTDLIIEWRPDIAIVDIGLPGRDGFGVAREVRKSISAEHNQPQPHLIALTGYGLPSDRVKVLEAGFNLHLVKPVNLDELFDVLHRIASG